MNQKMVLYIQLREMLSTQLREMLPTLNFFALYNKKIQKRFL